ncbi:MAG: hypothetical protein ACRCU2_27715 [Planktothrix sp.]
MNSINIPLAIAQGNYSPIDDATLKVWSTGEETRLVKPNWFGSIIVTKESLQKVAISDLKQRHQVIAQKHPVFQGKMTDKWVDNYLIFVYSKSAEYQNGQRIYPEFYGLESFYQFVASLSDVEMLAAHSYAALLYSSQGYQSSSIDKIVSWCYEQTEEEGFSFALID